MKKFIKWLLSFFGSGSSSGKVAFATDFLRGWNGGNCPLFLFSEATTEDQAKACVKWLKDGGYTVINPYFWNAKDGDGKHPVDVRQNPDTVKRRLKMCKDAGLRVIPILFADDSKGITSQPMTTLTKMTSDAVAKYRKSIAAVIVALEPDDSFTDGTVHALGNAVNSMGIRTGIHTNPVLTNGGDFNAHQVRYGKASWCDFVCLQTSFPGSPTTPSRMKKAIDGTRQHCPGKKVIAFEYAFDQLSLGDAAVEYGADGIGNEATRGAIEKLPKWV